MQPFHATIHARPPELQRGETIEVAGRSLTPLDVASNELARSFRLTFEDAEQALGRFPGLYCEPDGSFVWRGGAPDSWQLDGHLFDCGGRLLYVELKGTCSSGALDNLLSALGWPETPLVFQLFREGVVLDEVEFRRDAQFE